MSATPTAPAKNPFVTIAGNPVSPGTSPLATAPYAEALRKTLGTDRVEAYSRDTKRLVAPELTASAHGFIAAAQAAYAGHYPLVLSPDIIWLLIAQGFAIHVRENAAASHHPFFAREGKPGITFREGEFIAGFESDNGESIIRRISRQVQEQIGLEAHASVVPNFSTTGTTVKVAFEATDVDTSPSFISILPKSEPGIPTFHLEGTTDDWKWIRAHAEVLREYDIKWWMYDLLPALDEFIAAIEGNPTPIFWQNFYREWNDGRFDYVAGRFLRFLPYIPQFSESTPGDIDDATQVKIELFKEETGMVDYHLREEAQKELADISDANSYAIGLKRLRCSMDMKFKRAAMEISKRLGLPEFIDLYFDRNPMVQMPVRATSLRGKLTSYDYFSSGFCKLSVTLSSPMNDYQVDFVAGFVGVAQDASTLAVRPEIGWAVCDRQVEQSEREAQQRRRDSLEELAALTQEIGLEY